MNIFLIYKLHKYSSWWAYMSALHIYSEESLPAELLTHQA